MGAPIGNTNATKNQPWRDAINRALELRSKCRSDGRDALVAIADALLTKAEEGDIAAIKELGDRQDGRAAQAVTLGSDPDKPLVMTWQNPK